ncbi:FUSC family membrane protein [Curvibacter sp. HBC28]|uniref:FUSC family membrane protein n=2 Tax=Curvibacter microcysteis TaxID=3026419 RepID=A0ABT5MFY8_9BURK|nr:FUSC family membrane protein [Curvibacter sp. HBC28]
MTLLPPLLPMLPLSPLNWLFRIPAHVLNGLSVALGIGLIQWWFGSQASLHVAQLVSSGAVFASLADVPTTPGRSWPRVLMAAVLGSLSAAVVAFLDPYPRVLGLAIMGLVFISMMTLAWGPRAGPVSFAAILSIVFTMGVPDGTSPWVLTGWNLVGAALYLGWSQLTIRVLQKRYRSLALATALQATARLLRSRADAMLDEGQTATAAQALHTWVRDEAQLAERLQAARDLLFAAPPSARAQRETAVLLRAIDLRDILLASRLDLDLLGTDELATQVRARLAQRLRAMADELALAQARLRGVRVPRPEAQAPLSDLLDSLQNSPLLAPEDLRARLLPALINRVRHLQDDVQAIHRLLDQGPSEQPLSAAELQLFVAPEGWPLSAFEAHRTLASPVLRHALRASLALGAAYYIGLALPWSSHPQWMVLSVAVVLRGNIEQTLSRRNLRVLGTLLGCVIVVGLAHVSSPLLMMLVFLLAVGLAHSFAIERYLITAVAATVMALLQAHMAHPSTGFPIAERVADTLLGAAMAWAFCYVLPSWERRSLPRSLPRVLAALRHYAAESLRPHDPADPGMAVRQRLARRQAYDALGALAAGLQRSSYEPRQVQLPWVPLTALLDHGQRLMAHLSMLRLMRLRDGPEMHQAEALTALGQAQQSLQDLLDPASQGAGEAEIEARALDTKQTLLPSEPPTDKVLPWLHRRLQVTQLDAARTAAAARAALAELKRPPAR